MRSRKERGITGGSGAILALLLSLTLLVGPLGTSAATAKTTLRSKLLAMINDARADHGLRRLKLNVDLSVDARRHTRRMIDQDRLFHSATLPDALRPYHWTAWGENVGCAGTLYRLHRAFMRSPDHRSNILNPDFRRIGLGVLKAASNTICGNKRSVWATEIFYG